MTGGGWEVAVEVLAPEKVPSERPTCLPNLLLFLLCPETAVWAFNCPSNFKSRFKKKEKKEKHSEAERETTREGARKSMVATFSVDKSAGRKGASAGIGTQWKAGALNECGGARKAMNYAVGCKSSFIKCFGKGQILELPDFLSFVFSETPCLCDALSSFHHKTPRLTSELFFFHIKSPTVILNATFFLKTVPPIWQPCFMFYEA